MSDREWLEQLEAGDRVIVLDVFGPSLRRVERTTETQIIVGPHKYRRKDGDIVGRDSWSHNRIVEPTEQRISLAWRNKLSKYIRNNVDVFVDKATNEELNELAMSIKKVMDGNKDE